MPAHYGAMKTNTLNLAHMPSVRDVWHNLPFDSCPLLWPLLVRGCGMLGLTNGDMAIRILGLRYRFVLSDLSVAVPALDRRTHAYLEHRVAGWFTRVHFPRRSESSLWSGELPAGIQFRQDLAGLGIFDHLADCFGLCYLPAIRPLSLL